MATIRKRYWLTGAVVLALAAVAMWWLRPAPISGRGVPSSWTPRRGNRWRALSSSRSGTSERSAGRIPIGTTTTSTRS